MGNLYGLLGYPVGHSLSPIMHNKTFQSLGLDHYYHKFSIHPNELEAALTGIRTLGIKGFNVTIPHKVSVMNYLDEVDDLAREIGAVNTVKINDGRLIGYNTDGAGFVMALKNILKGSIATKKILLIGAGGAARAIYYTLLQKEGVTDIDIANRTVEKAKQLIGQEKENINSMALSITEAEANLSKYEIVINTTSLGMSPKLDEFPISLDHMAVGTFLSDIIYNPIETSWIRLGKEKGAVTQNGVGMFIGQGALAFELWTGIQPDFSFMEQIVINELGGK